MYPLGSLVGFLFSKKCFIADAFRKVGLLKALASRESL